MASKLFCFSCGHDNSHPYMIYTDDVLAASPVWAVNNTGLPDRPIPGQIPGNMEALSTWTNDPQAPMDRFFGVLYEGASGTSQALWRNDDIRNGGTWALKLTLDQVKTLLGNSSITDLQFGCVATTRAVSGFVYVAIRVMNGASVVGIYCVHSHDLGETWTISTIWGTTTYSPAPLSGGIAPNGSVLIAEVRATASTNLYTFVSTDGGHTWGYTGYPVGGVSIATLAIPDTTNDTAQTLYATAYTGSVAGGLYKSTNRGANWARLVQAVAPYYMAVVSAPNESEVVAWWHHSSSGTVPTKGKALNVSTDGGANWTESAAAPDYIRSVRAVSATTWLGGLGYTILATNATAWCASYDTGTGVWTDRSGNLSSLFTTPTQTRFCNIVGVQEVEVKGGPQVVICG